MKNLFVTQSYYDELTDKIIRMRGELEFIRSEQAYAYEHCGDGWHDNPYYSHLISQEKGIQNQLNDLQAQMQCSEIIKKQSFSIECVALCTMVVVREVNVKTNAEYTREISVVPVGAEDSATGAMAYNSPYARALIGAKVGDAIEITIPSGELEVTIMEIKKYEGEKL